MTQHDDFLRFWGCPANTWTYLDLSGPLWTYRDLSGPIGPIWTYRDLSGPIGTYRDLSRPMGTYRDLSGPIDTYRQLSGPIGTYGTNLDLWWTYVCWTMLDLCRTYTGPMLDQCWTYAGPMLDLCWTYAGPVTYAPLGSMLHGDPRVPGGSMGLGGHRGPGPQGSQVPRGCQGLRCPGDPRAQVAPWGQGAQVEPTVVHHGSTHDGHGDVVVVVRLAHAGPACASHRAASRQTSKVARRRWYRHSRPSNPFAVQHVLRVCEVGLWCASGAFRSN